MIGIPAVATGRSPEPRKLTSKMSTLLSNNGNYRCLLFLNRHLRCRFGLFRPSGGGSALSFWSTTNKIKKNGIDAVNSIFFDTASF